MDNYIATKQKAMFEDDRWRARWKKKFRKEGKKVWEGEELDEKKRFGLFIFWFNILDVKK